ncbi:MAG: hypothetical protein ACLRXB_08820 [Escherichia coli]
MQLTLARSGCRHYNAGKADATGVELEAKWRFAPGWSWISMAT